MSNGDKASVWEDGNFGEVNGGGGRPAMEPGLFSPTVNFKKWLRQLTQSLNYKLRRET